MLVLFREVRQFCFTTRAVNKQAYTYDFTTGLVLQHLLLCTEPPVVTMSSTISTRVPGSILKPRRNVITPFRVL